ncbi:hypothetical protein [Mucilaginibacter sp. HD30]
MGSGVHTSATLIPEFFTTLDMRYVNFYKTKDEQGVELTYNSTVFKKVIHWDLLTAIGDDTVTLKYPLAKKEFEQYQKQTELIHDTLIQHDLLNRRESKYHHSNLLFLLIEFNRQYKNLLADKARDARLNNMIEFLKLTKPLTPLQKQNVEMSFVINGTPFSFEDQPILSEMAINKLAGILMNNIRQLYPELWEIHLKRGGNPKALKERAVADSTLQNQAVADIVKILIEYLNSDSQVLSNPTAKPDKVTLSSKQGAFVYDLLVALKIYDPREKSKTDTGGKEANYHGLRKLIERY